MIQRNKKIRITGIDPGSNRVGICTLENGVYMGSNQINIEHLANFYDRLRIVQQQIEINLQNYGPSDYYAIEMPWVGFNSNVAIKLGQVRGLIVGSILRYVQPVEIIDITPMQIRAYLGIDKRAKKEEMHEAINEIFQGQLGGVIDLKKNQDELDAIGVAIAAYNKVMIKNLGVRSNENICINLN